MGFSSFFEKATLAGRMPQVIAGGSRRRTFEKFCVALRARKPDEFIVLLVDSEDPVAAGAGPWQHLAARDRWQRPQDAADENAHLMVECMEAWFLADPEALAEYFGRDFNRDALPRRREVEEVAKADVFDGLKNATRPCRKGEYRKGRHSFDILERIDPAKILDASPQTERLVDILREKAGWGPGPSGGDAAEPLVSCAWTTSASPPWALHQKPGGVLQMASCPASLSSRSQDPHSVPVRTEKVIGSHPESPSSLRRNR